ncbi:MAG: Asp-tRNA(Asn)/Glu-tRNA(Gln) amidotransferase subunit GatC [Gaiellales bacterium]|nr:Asp-tRNA(Asn)/Glu-tRNA(Gln) amidotransferase subunit GatC [Gaiellales bacterium]
MADVELTPDEVRHVATLARLGLDDAEIERLGRELTSILAHVNTIASLPIADVPPTKHSHENADSLRPDVARPGVPRAEALRNAPDPSADGFRVPPIGA